MSLGAFFLSMAMHPDVQRKAQDELDRVVGKDRLPTFADRDALPYVSALLKELLRWHVVAPIATPHRTVADDEYNGYHIPAGATIIPNVWYDESHETGLVVSLMISVHLPGQCLVTLRCTRTQIHSYLRGFSTRMASLISARATQGTSCGDLVEGHVTLARSGELLTVTDAR